eukprot:tig00000093_g3580.t1
MPDPAVLTVCLNGALDVSLTLDKPLEVGAVHVAKGKRVSPGGKANNTAKALAALQVPVLATGFQGGESGKQLIRGLTEKGVACDFVETKNGTRACYMLVAAGQGHTVVNEEGPEVSPEEQAAALAKVAALARRCQGMVLAGSLPPGCPKETYARIIDGVLSDAGSECSFLILDIHSEALLRVHDVLREKWRALRAADPHRRPRLFLKLNTDELGSTLRARSVPLANTSPVQVAEQMAQIAEEFGLDGALITNGAQPAHCFSFGGVPPVHASVHGHAASESFHEVFLAPKLKAFVSGVGSGDACNAGIAARLASGTSWREACIFGMACGAANAETLEPCDFTRMRAEELAAQIKAALSKKGAP